MPANWLMQRGGPEWSSSLYEILVRCLAWYVIMSMDR
jgi:hypothetical protein